MMGKYLPEEVIVKILSETSYFDRPRFSAVCKQWKSILCSLFQPRPSLYLPLSNFDYDRENLIFHKFYLFQRPYLQKRKPIASSSKCVHKYNWWLVQVSNFKNNNILLTNSALRKELNLLRVSITEVYSHTTERYDISSAILGSSVKLAVIPFPATPGDKFDAVMKIYRFGNSSKLAWKKSEDWINIDEQETGYEDIISYKGRFYAVHGSGKLLKIDVSRPIVTEVVPAIRSLASKRKELVESGGNLLLLDVESDYPSLKLRVYKLKEEHVWVEVKSLGKDRAVLFHQWFPWCFSFPIGNMSGFNRNCIYFHQGSGVGVFNLEDGSYCSPDDTTESWSKPFHFLRSNHSRDSAAGHSDPEHDGTETKTVTSNHDMALENLIDSVAALQIQPPHNG